MGDLFDFIVNNADMLEQIALNEDDGNIELEPSEYDFSHGDLEMETRDDHLVFTVDVPPFKLVTSIMSDEVHDYVDKLKSIQSDDVRKEIVETLEGPFLEDSQAEKDNAKDSLEEAKGIMDDVNAKHDNIVKSLRDVKDSWGIS